VTPVPPPQHASGATPPGLPASAVPQHVAIVMDGNGRWAKQRGCVNYGGRAEIADAARAIALKVAAGEINPSKITAKTLAAHMDEPDMPDVDLFWRSSGEQRSSNFLPWQAAYAEYVFSDVLWPDVNRTHLWAAIEEYARRNRRFGAAE